MSPPNEVMENRNKNKFKITNREKKTSKNM